MKVQSIVIILLKGAPFLALCLALNACHRHEAGSQVAIEFTRVPPAAQGGRERVDTIAGRVVGARPGEQIVIYARSGPWWVQPWPDRPFIPIHPDSTWSTETHLGYEYAALLVGPDYHPPPTMDVAPTEGGPVALVKIVKGVGPPQLAPTKPLHFSGYDWKVRTIASDRGGMNNLYDGDNAWVDTAGAMHLRIAKKQDKWSCAEVVLDRSLGYGTYVVTVEDASKLEAAAVLSMTTFDDRSGDQYYREMDVEIGRWGDGASKTNAQYAIQPFYVPGNIFPFKIPAGTFTHTMRWESGRANFKTWHGASISPGARGLTQHEFTSGIPSPGQERVQFLFYVVPSEKYPMQKGSEIVLEKFQYLP